MPYDSFQEDGKWCVYKLSADNTPSGEALGCHDSEGDARRQMQALYANEAQKGYVAPRPIGPLSRVKGGLTMYKGADGLRYMMIVTSNSYEDRDKETITTRALKEYVDRAWAVEDKCLPDNVALFWHDGDPIGDVVWTDTEGPFLYEVIKERPNKRINLTTEGRKVISTIKNIWNFIESNPRRYRWGASHGFKYFDSAKKNGVYQRIAKFETSVLPLDAAANPYTFAGVINDMNKDKVLNDLVSIPGFAGKFRKGIRQIAADLKNAGLQHKAVKQNATKGMLDDARQVIFDALSKIGNVPEGMADTVLQQIVTAMSAGMDTAAAVEPDGDEMGVTYDEVGDDPVTDTGDDSMNGKPLAAKEAAQVKLLDRLITSQGQMAEAQIGLLENAEQTQKALADVTKALEPVAKVVTTVDDLSARLKAIEDRLKGAPRRAALAEETVIDNAKITAHAEKMLENVEELFPGTGIKIKKE